MGIRFSFSDVAENAADKTGPFTPELSAVELVMIIYAFSILSEHDWLITDRTEDTAEAIAGVLGAMLNET